MSSSDYKQKYLKYKQKYLDLKNQLAGAIYYDESRNIERVDRELNEVLLDRRYEFGTWNLFVKYADDFVFKVRDPKHMRTLRVFKKADTSDFGIITSAKLIGDREFEIKYKFGLWGERVFVDKIENLNKYFFTFNEYNK